jgi:MFS family permease
MVGNPFFGKMSDRTSSRVGMRRPWMVIGLVGGSLGILVVALAPSIAVVLVGWCLAQLLFNVLLAAMVAVLPDQVPGAQRGLVAGVLGICTPIALVSGTFLVKLFTGNQLAMFLAPCAIGGFFILLFAVTLKDRRLAKADKPTWSLREFASTFLCQSAKGPRLRLGIRQPLHVRSGLRLPGYLSGLLPAGKDRQRQGRGTTADISGHTRPVRRRRRRFPHRRQTSDRTGRRKIFVLTASIVYGAAMFVIAIASNFNGFLVGMAIGGLGFGIYVAVDLALVVDVLPDKDNATKDLGVFNMAGALPFSIAPGIAPAILAVGSGSYGVLYAVAGVCAIVGAAAILPVKGVR